ncbi:uncharacterized protein MELLADRAFT_115546 [Melampsora larici-populina 98AG31]|uniref:Uncharacterized protein n=1 Tax=Melampsora larici-populina (strain 98AG31 / pathotype 3-4-7) TaxID=747676 RepID=F4RB27_MELLP|nr:uncharacterized protein MELLADRAFT_115546 [Melampsora larici-populina 98AG31]EGG10336.1 hypothetical protein MELLADRAFT_115546 [Melampsora larici-populina 98AG31]
MPSDLRKRNLTELPRTLNNPRPRSPDAPTHTSLNRHKPTIAPTVFIILVFFLTALLFPVFYYTQVMIPHPDSTSMLSHFKREGHKLLSGLGHLSQTGPGRQKFVPDLKAQKIADEIQDSEQVVEEVDKQTLLTGSITKSKEDSIDQIRSLLSDPKFKSGLKKSNHQTGSDPSMSQEERDKLDEQLGKFWQASSRYRSEAQGKEEGQYAITGDGISKSKSDSNNKAGSAIDSLPDADPDAKEGLTPEVWAAISEQLTADQLTVMLDAVRTKEI